MDHGLQLIRYVYWKMPLMLFINGQITVVFPVFVGKMLYYAIIAFSVLSGFYLSTAWDYNHTPVEDFNSHSRTGSDTGMSYYRYTEVNFNPHSRTGSDIPAFIVRRCFLYFNPHSRTGSDTKNIQKNNF